LSVLASRNHKSKSCKYKKLGSNRFSKLIFLEKQAQDAFRKFWFQKSELNKDKPLDSVDWKIEISSFLIEESSMI
jgi:hypothetical protein